MTIHRERAEEREGSEGTADQSPSAGGWEDRGNQGQGPIRPRKRRHLEMGGECRVRTGKHR